MEEILQAFMERGKAVQKTDSAIRDFSARMFIEFSQIYKEMYGNEPDNNDNPNKTFIRAQIDMYSAILRRNKIRFNEAYLKFAVSVAETLNCRPLLNEPVIFLAIYENCKKNSEYISATIKLMDACNYWGTA